MPAIFRGLVIAVFLLIFSVIPSFAAEEFDSNLTTTYTIDRQGNTHVEHEIVIKNNTPTTFITQYNLSLSSPSLENVIIKNEGEVIEAKVDQTNNKTNIAIEFPNEVVGQGKQRRFSIAYDTPDLALVAGNVLELHVPQLNTDKLTDSHKVIIYSPIFFGNPIRISPPPDSREIDPNGIKLVYNNVPAQSISALYGETQTFNMTLRYYLENNTGNPGIIQVALPPDTPYQKMHYHVLEPSTNDIKVDEDGNWIATYTIAPNTTQEVYLTASAQLSLERDVEIPFSQPLPAHTQAEKYWETQNTEIKTVASQYQSTEAIYDYVVDTLDYSYDAALGSPTRLGASEALRNPLQAICQEFTDLFIALSRANNIPARRITGYAYANNDQLRPLSLRSDVLHAWPEYFNFETNTWIPVDPTWGDTTGGIDYFNQFDLNHIVFARNGVSSTLPYPAGAYKPSEIETKDVDVTIAEQPIPVIPPNYSINVLPRKIAKKISMPGKYMVTITNNTGQAWYNLAVEMSANNDIQLQPTHYTIPTILPYQTIEIPITSYTSSFLQRPGTMTTIIQTAYQPDNVQQQTEITSGSNYFKVITDQEFYFALAVGSTCAVLTTGGILVFRRRQQRVVRGQSQEPEETS